MSRNTKHKDYKRFFSVVRKQSEIKSQIKALGYRTLDKPIHHGYNAYFTLREYAKEMIDYLGLTNILSIIFNTTLEL
jgi:hypothetical protein